MNFNSLSLLLLVSTATAFAPPARPMTTTTRAVTTTSLFDLLSVTLDKPLGLLLEEMEEGAPMGVKVESLGEGGSAFASDYKDQLVGLKLAEVMGENVGSLDFDSVMEKIIEAPSPVTIAFEVDGDVEEEEEGLPVGTAVVITVVQEGKEDMTIDAKVGDNLRATLLENNVEVYRGLKKKMGNCGGGGQCGFCAVRMTNDDEWCERSDYETNKIGKQGPEVRLSCLNNIQGSATVETL